MVLGSSVKWMVLKLSGLSRMMEEVVEVTVSRREPGQKERRCYLAPAHNKIMCPDLISGQRPNSTGCALHQDTLFSLLKTEATPAFDLCKALTAVTQDERTTRDKCWGRVVFAPFISCYTQVWLQGPSGFLLSVYMIYRSLAVPQWFLS